MVEYSIANYSVSWRTFYPLEVRYSSFFRDYHPALCITYITFYTPMQMTENRTVEETNGRTFVR